MYKINTYHGFDTRNDASFIKKNGKRKAFHTGGNSSCRQHIRQHYEIYKQRCKEGKIPEHHWAIPRPIWNKMQDEKRGIKTERQGTLDGLLIKKTEPLVFSRENVLHSVTQFVAVDDQVKTHL
jgi:hypothetical protein